MAIDWHPGWNFAVPMAGYGKLIQLEVFFLLCYDLLSVLRENIFNIGWDGMGLSHLTILALQRTVFFGMDFLSKYLFLFSFYPLLVIPLFVRNYHGNVSDRND